VIIINQFHIEIIWFLIITILVDDLRELQKEYDKRMNFIIHNQRQNNLSDIYKLINTVRGYPSVYEQLAAAKEGQRMMMQQYEHEVPKAEQTYL
jgi:hypothetical protein